MNLTGNTDERLISAELSLMGFKGMQINSLQRYVFNQRTLEDLQNYIILHGDGMKKAILISSFIEFTQSKYSFSNCEQFINAYKSCNLQVEKVKVVAKLLVVKEVPKLDKVVIFVDSGKIPMNEVYTKFTKWRRLYTLDQILTLIDKV